MNSKSEVIKIDIEELKYGSVFPYCRKLLREDKVNPKSRVEVYSGEEFRYACSSVEEGAKLIIVENDEVGPKFGKYRPMPENLKERDRGNTLK